MTETVIIDARNPGEVLACAGLAWLAARADPNAQSGFEAGGGQWQFSLPTSLESLDTFLDAAPQANDDHVNLGALRLDWWERPWGLNPGFKFWAGQQSAASVLGNLSRACQGGSINDWLTYTASTGGRLGVDPLGTWNALALGWSINEHQHLQMYCRPFVEWLAFVALQVFPVQGERQTGFRYHLWRRCALPLAITAFAGYGRHALNGYVSTTEKAGSNSILRPAQPM